MHRPLDPQFQLLFQFLQPPPEGEGLFVLQQKFPQLLGGVEHHGPEFQPLFQGETRLIIVQPFLQAAHEFRGALIAHDPGTGLQFLGRQGEHLVNFP